MCLGPTNSTLHLDTGLVDSRADLGINGQDRTQWRKKMSCVPITTDGYIRAVRSDADQDGEFSPIPALSVPDATLTLIFATFFLSYLEPSDDAWLSAHTEVDVDILIASNSDDTVLKTYSQDQQVSVLACREQQQICNPTRHSNNTSVCTPFRSVSHDFTRDLEDVLDNGHQLMIAKTLLDVAPGLSFPDDIVRSPLLAEDLAGLPLSAPLAPNQWVLEVEHWFTIGLANLQRLMLDIVTGPSSSQYLQFIPQNQADNDTDLHWMCGNQIIRRSDYSNFRTCSISLIFGFGLLIYVANQSLETVVGWLRFKWRAGRSRQRAWWAEGTLQLQRRVFESMGILNWEVDEWDRIPVTEECRIG
ncbi:uncharacterized protein LY89DRAFT_717054 [Mollisia scopiformis]|uniref:Uncharacterized protein n=1 Tax=Mollisia scopiformis TaxID=149040 RepID=A0A194XHG6_MOLSC|nr:uncharacterized protein LY89DRAFT_717054 [Mollisia scopiformis]KUJ19581.1 hypothetical protein LY89DRAFT_717054 [Mollisia scopiformis]